MCYDNVRAVDDLIEKIKTIKCDLSTRGQTIKLIKTLTSRSNEMPSCDRGILKILNKAEWDPNNPKTGGPELIKIAIESDNLYLFNMLFEYGIDLKISDGILNLVCEYESIIIFDRLMKVNNGINEKNGRGRTALFSACLAGNFYIAETLLVKGAFINSWHDAGTPLHAACTSGNIYLVCLLLKRGAIIDIRNNFGETALHLACKLGRIGIVKLLLYFKAGINAVSITAQSPLDLAIIDGHLEIADCLLSKGAVVNLLLPASIIFEPGDENKRRMSNNEAKGKRMKKGKADYKNNPALYWRNPFIKKIIESKDDEACQHIEMIEYYMYQK